MSVFSKDVGHRQACPEHYGAPSNPDKPCGCSRMTPVDASTAELQQMAADGRGRSTVVKQLAKNELARRKA